MLERITLTLHVVYLLLYGYVVAGVLSADDDGWIRLLLTLVSAAVLGRLIRAFRAMDARTHGDVFSQAEAADRELRAARKGYRLLSLIPVALLAAAFFFSVALPAALLYVAFLAAVARRGGASIRFVGLALLPLLLLLQPEGWVRDPNGVVAILVACIATVAMLAPTPGFLRLFNAAFLVLTIPPVVLFALLAASGLIVGAGDFADPSGAMHEFTAATAASVVSLFLLLACPVAVRYAVARTRVEPVQRRIMMYAVSASAFLTSAATYLVVNSFDLPNMVVHYGPASALLVAPLLAVVACAYVPVLPDAATVVDAIRTRVMDPQAGPT